MNTVAWQNNVNALNDELTLLPGFECFDEKKILQTLANPALFSIGFEKEKGQGYLYGQDLATQRQQLFNLLDESAKKQYFLDKCSFLNLNQSLTSFLKLKKDITVDDIQSVKDIGMGHSVYWVTSQTGHHAVVKEVDKKHPKVYYNVLAVMGFSTLSIDYIENELGQWIISEYLDGQMLTESNLETVFSETCLMLMAQQAACADVLGRGDRHLENYIWANNTIYPVDISYLFWPENEVWVERYIEGGQSEYCLLILARTEELKTHYKNLFWDSYHNTIQSCVENKHALYDVLEHYYEKGDALRFKAYLNRVLDKPDTYIKQQKKRYNRAFDCFVDRYHLKKKLEKKAQENPAFVQTHPLLKMYHDSNQNRLTAFFLVDYHQRLDTISGLI